MIPPLGFDPTDPEAHGVDPTSKYNPLNTDFLDTPLVIPVGDDVVIEYGLESVMMPEEKAREVMNDLTVYFNDKDVIKNKEDLKRAAPGLQIFEASEMPNLEKLMREWNRGERPETD